MIAVYYVHQTKKQDVLDALVSILGEGIHDEHLTFLSSWGKESQLLNSFDRSAHYLSPLNKNVKKAVVFKSAIRLFARSRSALCFGICCVT